MVMSEAHAPVVILKDHGVSALAIVEFMNGPIWQMEALSQEANIEIQM